MKYKEFHKFIEEQYAEKKQPMFERIIDGLPFPAESMNAQSPSATKQPATAAETPAAKPAAKRRTSFKHSFKNFFKTPARLAACVSAAVAIVCIAVFLPFTLNNRSGSQTATTNPSTTPEDRFCAAATCKQLELKYSLKEYSARNNLSLLYVDWYDVAEIKTSMYVNKENSFDIVYYEEILRHKYTGSIAELYVTDLRTNVDILLDYMKACKNKYVPQNPRATVYWGSDVVENDEHNMYTASILYNNRAYILVLRYPISENSFFELIDSMLPAIRR